MSGIGHKLLLYALGTTLIEFVAVRLEGWQSNLSENLHCHYFFVFKVAN